MTLNNFVTIDKSTEPIIQRLVAHNCTHHCTKTNDSLITSYYSHKTNLLDHHLINRHALSEVSITQYEYNIVIHLN